LIDVISPKPSSLTGRLNALSVAAEDDRVGTGDHAAPALSIRTIAVWPRASAGGAGFAGAASPRLWVHVSRGKLSRRKAAIFRGEWAVQESNLQPWD
jgi:hypothetical protein